MATSRRRHRLGQHFLTDMRVLERQLRYADLQPTDTVLEIGPGLGVLTQRLRDRVARVIAVELDPGMIEELKRRGLPDERVAIVHGDAANMDYTQLGAFNKVVANLPYSASSPITFQLLPLRFELACLMYQLEFAERLVADQTSGDYGRLSAARAYFAEAEIMERVPRGAFSPPPDVSSALVLLRPHPRPPFQVGSASSYLEFLRVVFSTRRKTLRSTLKKQHAELGYGLARVEQVLASLGVGDRRPEEMTPAELGAVDHALSAVTDG
jgi:16S rRNA (adenine1518-N6/adenine1519-N6)-dimethyltransferase